MRTKNIVAGIALNDAKAGDMVQVSTGGIYKFKKEKPKKLLGKTIDEEKTELEKWFDLLEITKKKETEKIKVSPYFIGSAIMMSGSGFTI